MNTDEKRKQVIVLHESAGHSIVTGIVTFGCLCLAFWFNHAFLGDGVVLQIVLGVAFFIAVLGRTSNGIRRMKPREALAYLEKHYPPAESVK